jgi:hypothetical protein
MLLPAFVRLRVFARVPYLAVVEKLNGQTATSQPIK